MMTMVRTTFLFPRLPMMAHGFAGPSSSVLGAARVATTPHYWHVRGVGRHDDHHHHHHHRLMASVTGTVYTSSTGDDDGEGGKPTITVRLFTKEGCTLCDKVKDVLVGLREDYPHSLEQVDITDEEHSEWFSKYKYDIPVLHLENKFWIKHRITMEEATEGLIQARDGSFQARPGEPDAGAMERKQSERQPT